MDLYTRTAYQSSKLLTLNYSTSFSLSSRLFAPSIRPHIYAIYGLARLADEITDTHKASNAPARLDQLEAEAYTALDTGYSTNLIVHAFAQTARLYGIDGSLLEPFFSSMRMDTTSRATYTVTQYRTYIHGSAEVVGLMCLRVFCGGNSKQYAALKDGAIALGAAYQKVNFLRDFAADYKELGRVYFPGVTYESFDDAAKAATIADIHTDFSKAVPALQQLPCPCRLATRLSYAYYAQLLHKLERTSAATIKEQRVRVSNARKFVLLIKVLLTESWKP